MATKKNTVTPLPNGDGVYIYLGPTIKGVINNAAIFRGTRANILTRLSDVIEKYPKVERLLIADTDVVEARKKISTGINSLSTAYKALMVGNN